MKTNSITSAKKYRSELALLLVTLFWSATFTIVKESLYDISSMLFIAFRFAFAALILLPFVLKYKSLFSRESVKAGVILGLLMFGAFASQTVGLKFTTATKSGFITGSAVVMIPIMQTLIERRKPNTGGVLGVIIVFIGILFLSSGGDSISTFLDDLGSNFNLGDWLTLLCALMVAIHVIYLDLFTKRYEFIVLLFTQIAVVGMTSLLTGIFFASVSIEELKVEFTQYIIFALIYTSLFATLITTALQTRYQKDVSPTKAGIIYSFEPIFAAFIAFFALNEKITNFGLVGCTLIFSGLIISEVYDSLIKANGKQRG